MNKVLILSDSHGLTREITTIKERHQLENIIHCGDSELDYDSKELEDVYKVAGNCDFDSRYPNEAVITIGDVTFFITHGHLHNVKMNIMPLSYRADEMGANVICFGHTHVAGAEQVGQQLFINPGSIRMPRNRPEKTYAIVEWQRREEVKVTFYTLDGNEVEELSCKASL